MAEPRFRGLGWPGRAVHATRVSGEGEVPPFGTVCGRPTTRVGGEAMAPTDEAVTCRRCLLGVERRIEEARGEGLPRHRAALVALDLSRAGYYPHPRRRPCGAGVRIAATVPGGGPVDIRTEVQAHRLLLGKG